MSATTRILAVVLFGASAAAATACETQSDEECEKNFVRLVGPCVPVCEEVDPNGNASDQCIATCVNDRFGEQIPQC